MSFVRAFSLRSRRSPIRRSPGRLGTPVQALLTVLRPRGGTRPRAEALLRHGGPPLAHDKLTQLEDRSISFELRNSAKARGRGSYVILDPIALLRRLAWIIPPPFKNQIIYSGVFAGNAKLGKEIIPRRPAKAREVRMDLPPPPVPPLDVILANAAISPDETQPDTYIRWADLLRRTHQIDALRCERCKGRLRPIATISAKLAPKILDHLGMDSKVPRLRPARGPP